MHITRRIAIASLAAVALAAPAAAAHAEPGKPSTPPRQLLLTQAEFPTGYKVVPLDGTQLRDALSGAGAAVSGATVTPPQCRNATNPQDLGRAASLPLVAAANQFRRTVLAETLSDTASTQALSRPGCERVRVQTHSPVGKVEMIDLTVNSTPIALAGAPSGSQAVVVRSTGTVTVNGKAQRVAQEQVLASNRVRGYTIVIDGTAINKGSSATARADAAAALTTATAKVQSAP